MELFWKAGMEPRTSVCEPLFICTVNCYARVLMSTHKYSSIAVHCAYQHDHLINMDAADLSIIEEWHAGSNDLTKLHT